MLSYGQTTITEGWNTCYDTGDGTYAVNGSMNHFGLGTVGQWLYSDVLGIQRDVDNPGYKHFYIKPQVGGGLTHVSGSYESVYGTIESGWHVDGNEHCPESMKGCNKTWITTDKKEYSILWFPVLMKRKLWRPQRQSF